MSSDKGPSPLCIIYITKEMLPLKRLQGVIFSKTKPRLSFFLHFPIFKLFSLSEDIVEIGEGADTMQN